MRTRNFTQRLIHFLLERYNPRGAHKSFATTGEDLIIQAALHAAGITQATYVDIGAHHPIFSNNTYFFYRQGGRGVIIEPNKKLIEIAQHKRPRDTIVRAGAGATNNESLFYAFSQSTRSTFSKEQAEEWEKSSGQQPITSPLPLFSLDTIIQKFCNNTPDIVSIDAEGYDEEILRGFSWRVRPPVFCVESLEQSGQRNQALYDIFTNHQYRVYAETPANTIFIDTLVQ